MKLLTLTALVIAATATAADATPPMRMILAEQVAAAPDQPDSQTTGNSAAPGQTVSPSKKLSRTNGVIHPPPTHDPSVVKPPSAETTGKAVIPPPGTPGGDQTVQPK